MTSNTTAASHRGELKSAPPSPASSSKSIRSRDRTSKLTTPTVTDDEGYSSSILKYNAKASVQSKLRMERLELELELSSLDYTAQRIAVEQRGSPTGGRWQLRDRGGEKSGVNSPPRRSKRRGGSSHRREKRSGGGRGRQRRPQTTTPTGGAAGGSPPLSGAASPSPSNGSSSRGGGSSSFSISVVTQIW